MADALAPKLFPDVIEPSSAGLYPLGYIPAPTVAVLAEVGEFCEGRTSSALRESDLRAAHLMINMSGQAARKLFVALNDSLKFKKLLVARGKHRSYDAFKWPAGNHSGPE